MSFIRVTLRGEKKTKVDLNSIHIVHYRAGSNGGAEVGSDVTLLNDDILMVNESPRQLRSFIKKAQGALPVAAVVEVEPAPAE